MAAPLRRTALRLAMVRHRRTIIVGVLLLTCMLGYLFWPRGRKSWHAIVTDNTARQQCIASRQLDLVDRLEQLALGGHRFHTGRTAAGFAYLEDFYTPPAITHRDTPIVIVTQCTPDRLHKLDPMLSVWQGPVSVAVYLHDAHHEIHALMDAIAQSALISRYATVHVLYSVGTPYPVNSLRNLAISGSRSKWVLLVDVDFWPTGTAQDFMSQIELSSPAARTMLVVVSMSTTVEGVTPARLTHQNVTAMHDAGILAPSNLCACFGCHAPTNFDAWRQQHSSARGYTVQYSWFYEPFLLSRRAELPLYDERFQGYANDKVTHTFQAAVSGMQFVVLPRLAIVHAKHLPSPQAWDGSACSDGSHGSYIERDVHALVCGFLSEHRSSPKTTHLTSSAHTALSAPSTHSCWCGRCNLDVRIRVDVVGFAALTLLGHQAQLVSEVLLAATKALSLSASPLSVRVCTKTCFDVSSNSSLKDTHGLHQWWSVVPQDDGRVVAAAAQPEWFYGMQIHLQLVSVQPAVRQSQRALQFDGGRGRLVATLSSSELLAAGSTVETWLFRSGTGSGPNRQSVILALADSLVLVMDCWGLMRVFYDGDQRKEYHWPDLRFEAFCEGQHAVPAREWTHVAVSMQYKQQAGSWSTEWNLYLNGAFRAAVSAPMIVGIRHGQVTVGQSRLEHFIEPFEGFIDEVRLWSVVRSASQISADYRNNSPSASNGLIAHWSFDVAMAQQGVHNDKLHRAIAQLPGGLEGAGVVADLSGWGHTAYLDEGISKDQMVFGEETALAPRLVPFTAPELMGQ